MNPDSDQAPRAQPTTDRQVARRTLTVVLLIVLVVGAMGYGCVACMGAWDM